MAVLSQAGDLMDETQMQEQCARLLEEFSEIAEGFPYPDWKKIVQWRKQNLPDEDPGSFWRAVAVEWTDRIARNLGEGYQLSESDRFLLVSAEGQEADDRLLQFAENSLGRIRRSLGAIACPVGHGPHVILMMHDPDLFWRYLAHLTHRNKSMAASGVFINRGYGHIVLAPQAYWQVEQTLFHELSHNCLMHRRLPLWLDEGLTCSVQVEAGYEHRMQMDARTARKHWEYWDETKIQSFWSGWSFSRADEGSKRSYELAITLIHLLLSDVVRNRQGFEEFVSHASRNDGGEAAAREYLNRGLGEIAAIFLGKGDWAPKPETWPGAEKNAAAKTNGEQEAKAKTSSD